MEATAKLEVKEPLQLGAEWSSLAGSQVFRQG